MGSRRVVSETILVVVFSQSISAEFIVCTRVSLHALVYIYMKKLKDVQHTKEKG